MKSVNCLALIVTVYGCIHEKLKNYDGSSRTYPLSYSQWYYKASQISYICSLSLASLPWEKNEVLCTTDEMLPAFPIAVNESWVIYQIVSKMSNFSCVHWWDCVRKGCCGYILMHIMGLLTYSCRILRGFLQFPTANCKLVSINGTLVKSPQSSKILLLFTSTQTHGIEGPKFCEFWGCSCAYVKAVGF